MDKKKLSTMYAPAERADNKTIGRQSELFITNKTFQRIVEAFPSVVLILNKERQIIYANRIFMERFGNNCDQPVINQRPGEACQCLHAINGGNGCGTTIFCKVCGVVNAILDSQKGNHSTKECRLLTIKKEALDLKVNASPYDYMGERFTFFSIDDISNEKRRQALERVFFHDILNNAVGISVLSNVIQDAKKPAEVFDLARIINRSAGNLIDEIKSQKQINAAERGDLELNCTSIYSLDIIKEVSETYGRDEILNDKHLVIHKDSVNVKLTTDATLLRRILGNMIINALEASLPASSVTISCKNTSSLARFSVHNDIFMDDHIQLQLFKRSFSTKGNGRGIGTYSMKLFGEKYLNGKVWFESLKEKGTTFFIELPIIEKE